MSHEQPPKEVSEMYDALGTFKKVATRYARGAKDSHQRLRLSLAQKRENSCVGAPVPKELTEPPKK